MRGNVVDLAVAVVIGTAFGAVVNALVKDVIMPLITAIFGKQDYSNLIWTLNKSEIRYGDLITAIINFLCVGAAVYFFIVAPINHVNERRRARGVAIPQEPEETEKELLAEIRDILAQRAVG
ncbi:large conductance mechanosensitive channel protein MscL [Catenulispora subtropica]|uniref:Large conductance mechanosensitive channel protein MscL n=1 Tax=Catenulispora subtropica TaxID=450798 RepID=A0ABP5C2G8_9ACTN